MLWSLSVTVAVTPLSFAVSYPIKNLPALLLFATGVTLWMRRADLRHVARRAWMPLSAAVLMLLYGLLNVLLHGLGWDDVDLPSHIIAFLAMLPVFALPLRWAIIRIGFSASGALLGAVAAIQHYALGIPRPYGLNGGTWSAIEFAMLMLILALMGLVQVLAAGRSYLEKIWHAVCALLAIYGALLGQSRGPLLAFPLTLLVLLGLHIRQTRRWRDAVLVMLTLASLTLLANINLKQNILHRFEQVQKEAVTFDHRTNATGSVRERLEMWRIALRAFATHPLTGVGLNRFGDYARSMAAEGKANASIIRYKHPHNEYLGAAATGGVPGLLVLLALFAAPLSFFWRHALTRDDMAIAVTARLGLMVVCMYVLCALTDNVLYRTMPHSFYFFLMLGLSVRLASLIATRRTE